MARVAKTPLYEGFNSAVNCFGEKTTNKWDWKKYFGDTKPLYLELGCGKAEVTLALARLYPKNNYFGIDLKADRLWRPAKQSLAEGLANTAFMQTNILAIEQYFAPKSINGIWITFPDPFPKKRQAKHRMINRNFLDIYKKLLINDGVVRFKTDNQALFFWAIELLVAQKDVQLDTLLFDLHAAEVPNEFKAITTYEQKFMEKGQPIYYVQWHFV